MSYHGEPPTGGAPPPQKKCSNFWTWAAVLGVGYVLYDDWKRARHSDRTLFGYDAEEIVADYLSRCGAKVGISNGSRGAIDVYAEWSPRKRWGVQVKASRDGDAKLPRPAERDRLLDACDDWGARAVIALVDNGRTQYFDAETLLRIYPPKKQQRA